MSEQENIIVIRRIFDGLNNHDLNVVDSYIANDAKIEVPSAPGVIKDKQLNAFPDLHFDIRDIIAQGNSVAVTYSATGTQQGPLATMQEATIPPTNKLITLPGCNVYEFHNEMIVRQHFYADMLSLLSQLGVVPNMSQLVREK
jgi:predicted ester cyclase